MNGQCNLGPLLSLLSFNNITIPSKSEGQFIWRPGGSVRRLFLLVSLAWCLYGFLPGPHDQFVSVASPRRLAEPRDLKLIYRDENGEKPRNEAIAGQLLPNVH